MSPCVQVPREQRPVNELQQLKDTPLVAWVSGGYVAQAQESWTSLLAPWHAPPPPHTHPRMLRTAGPSLLWPQATLELPQYSQRMLLLFGGTFALLGGPIAAQTFDPAREPLAWALSAATGCLLVLAVASLRIFLAWKYVGDRLLTASLDYEETGW